MKLYQTVMNPAVSEQIIEKSRFITYVSPAESREEAENFIADISRKHRDATHNVPAFVLGDKMQVQWASDNGEPQGTSGAPIVRYLVNQEITNVVIVVTRYFGGIKLGTGGLVRAYTSSAQNGIAEAGICTVEEIQRLSCIVDYASFNKIQNYHFPMGNRIVDVEYAENVKFGLLSEESHLNECKSVLMQLSAGAVQFGGVTSVIEKIPI